MSDTITRFQTSITKREWQDRLKNLLERGFKKTEIIEQGILRIEQGEYTQK